MLEAHRKGRAVMKTIDVEGLPETVAQALLAMVETLKRQTATKSVAKAHAAIELPRWPGKVMSSLRREEIYADLG
jgi:hypothetical protein